MRRRARATEMGNPFRVCVSDAISGSTGQELSSGLPNRKTIQSESEGGRESNSRESRCHHGLRVGSGALGTRGPALPQKPSLFVRQAVYCGSLMRRGNAPFRIPSHFSLTWYSLAPGALLTGWHGLDSPFTTTPA
jgi:hypothetical protein